MEDFSHSFFFPSLYLTKIWKGGEKDEEKNSDSGCAVGYFGCCDERKRTTRYNTLFERLCYN
jgi:hypothetical protein